MENWQYILVACCIVPTLIMMVLAFFAVRGGFRFMRWLTPDEDRLIDRFIELRRENPRASTRKLIDKIVRAQSIRAGIVGAFTGVGGIFLLPIMLPVDLLSTGRIQSGTLRLIAWAYEMDHPGELPKVLDVDETLGLQQGGDLNLAIDERTHQLVIAQSGNFSRMVSRRLIREVGEKAFAKLIPGLGLIINFVANYMTVRATSEVAKAWYSRNIKQYGQKLRDARTHTGGLQLSPSLEQSAHKLKRQIEEIHTESRTSA